MSFENKEIREIIRTLGRHYFMNISCALIWNYLEFHWQRYKIVSVTFKLNMKIMWSFKVFIRIYICNILEILLAL